MTEFDMTEEELLAWHERMIGFLGTHHSANGDDFWRLQRFIEDYQYFQELIYS